MSKNRDVYKEYKISQVDNGFILGYLQENDEYTKLICTDLSDAFNKLQDFIFSKKVKKAPIVEKVTPKKEKIILRKLR